MQYYDINQAYYKLNGKNFEKLIGEDQVFSKPPIKLEVEHIGFDNVSAKGVYVIVFEGQRKLYQRSISSYIAQDETHLPNFNEKLLLYKINGKICKYNYLNRGFEYQEMANSVNEVLRTTYVGKNRVSGKDMFFINFKHEDLMFEFHDPNYVYQERIPEEHLYFLKDDEQNKITIKQNPIQENFLYKKFKSIYQIPIVGDHIGLEYLQLIGKPNPMIFGFGISPAVKCELIIAFQEKPIIIECQVEKLFPQDNFPDPSYYDAKSINDITENHKKLMCEKFEEDIIKPLTEAWEEYKNSK